MVKIDPSQFLEIILETQKQDKLHNEFPLKVRKFNEISDRLAECNYYLQFGFADLVEFSQRFKLIRPYAEYTLNLSYSDDLLEEVKSYNRIYRKLEHSERISKIWSDLEK